MIEVLKNSIDKMYSDESKSFVELINNNLEIKEERLREYTDGLVKVLSRTTAIVAFTKVLRAYMPKYNELKHFNAQKIASLFF